MSITLLACAAAAAAAKSLQSCLTLCDPIDGSPPGSASLGFSRQEHWSGLPFLSPVKGFGIVNETEISIFLELSCFFDDPADVGNLISDSSVFSKYSLNIWKFTLHVLLKSSLENFEHYFASM